MEDKHITKEAVMRVLKNYWQQYRNYTWQSLVAFLAPSLGTILVIFVPPLIMGKIIDIIAKDSFTSLTSIYGYIALLAFLWMLGELFWRLGLHYVIYVETRGISKLNRTAYKWLVDRDYDFYTNHFIGSLTKKAISLSRNFEVFTDTLLYNVFTNIIPVIFVVIVLWGYSPIIPSVLILCFTVVARTPNLVHHSCILPT